MEGSEAGEGERYMELWTRETNTIHSGWHSHIDRQKHLFWPVPFFM